MKRIRYYKFIEYKDFQGYPVRQIQDGLSWAASNTLNGQGLWVCHNDKGEFICQIKEREVSPWLIERANEQGLEPTESFAMPELSDFKKRGLK